MGEVKEDGSKRRGQTVIENMTLELQRHDGVKSGKPV